MAKYSLADIKNLREITGAGMMDVKNALEEAEGDKDRAMEIIRLKGLKSLSKREGRTASAGLVAAKVVQEDGAQVGVMVEVNAETDFVAKNQKFLDFAEKVMQAALDSKAATAEELLAAPAGDGTVQDLVNDMAALVGEKVELGGIARLAGDCVDAYLHHSSADLPPQVGVLVATDEKAAEVARDVAMHIAAYQPLYVTRDDVPADVLEKERATLEKLTLQEGKPEHIVPRIVEGRLNVFFKDNCLLDQDFAKDPSSTVGKVVKATGGQIIGFARFHVGA